MKKTSLLLCSAILLTACSKTVKEVSTLRNQSESKGSVIASDAKTDLGTLRNLLSSEAPNLALAELLARSVSKEHKNDLKALVGELSADEASEIIKKVEKDNLSVRSNYLYHGQAYGNDKKLISELLLDASSTQNHPFSIESQLTISTVAYLKSRMLDQIISTYENRAAELAQDLAQEIAYDIGANHSQLASEIEVAMKNGSKSKLVEMIQKAAPVVYKIDKYFITSELNENEQYVVLIGGIIAGTIYDQVKDNRGFQRIVEQGKKVVRDVKKFEAKAKEFSMLVNTLNTHVEESRVNLKDLKDGMLGARDDVFNLYQKVKAGPKGPVDFESKKIVEFLYKRVIKGEEANTLGINPSILSKQVSFNDNFKKTLTAASNLTNNLTSIVNTAHKLAHLFKIGPSNDLMKVLDKAQKVNAVIQGAQSVMVGFAAGGFVGAIGALSSGPMMSLMGGGGGDSAALEAINKKLDMVLENQQKIMQMQVETMNMIKDLALMVDIYHQREMAALAELRDYSMISQELQKAQLNKDIRSCERMINFQLSSVWKSMDFGKDAFYSINNLELINSRFTQSIRGLHDIRRIVNSVEEDGFKNCQSAIAEAFGGNSYEENPIRSIFSSSADENLYKFQRDTYLPLLTSLKHFTGSSNFDGMPLHLPTKDMKGLRYKEHHFRIDRTMGTGEVYELDQLLSVKNLERYLSHLIVMLPLLEVDKNIWFKSYDEIISTYIENSNSGNNQNIRSQFFLMNALKMTQSAIAQEAILSGEPLLPELHSQFANAIFSEKECADIKEDKAPETSDIPFFCAIRENRLLMKNLLMYGLSASASANPDILTTYAEAYKNGDRNTLSQMVNMGVTNQRIEVIKNNEGAVQEIVINLLVQDHDKDNKSEKFAIKLPTPEVLVSDKILYSENMGRLLKMQDAILNNLEKVAPVKRDSKGRDLLKLLLVNM